LEKVSIKQPVLSFFSNSKSLELPGLIIESLEYVDLTTFLEICKKNRWFLGVCI
jgi:hypothetical protein